MAGKKCKGLNLLLRVELVEVTLEDFQGRAVPARVHTPVDISTGALAELLDNGKSDVGEDL
jgi:hypothetical protein